MKETVYQQLQTLGISYTVAEHPAVFTMEDMHVQGLNAKGVLCKNLFVRDAKGKRHFLVVAREETPVQLHALGETLEAGKLSFASPQRLETYLAAVSGAVSPLDILWDEGHSVTVVLDQALQGEALLGVHPNDNTATVFLHWDDLVRFIQAQGNPLLVLPL